MKSGKLWWTVPLANGGKVRFISRLVLIVPVIPDGDHLPLSDGRVQLPHATDVLRPLELLRVDEKDRLFDLRKDLFF